LKHVALTGEKKNGLEIFGRKLFRKEDNIEIGLKEYDGMVCCRLDAYGSGWRAVVNTNDLRVP
jgi:hypothetical protein